MPKASPRGRPRQFDENLALDQLLEVFRQKGFAATSLDDLTAATGLNRPSLYGAFGNKEALFKAVIDHYWQRTGRTYLRALFEGESLAEGLRNMCRVFLDTVSRTDPGGCIVVCALPSAATENLSHTEYLADIFAQSDVSLRKRIRMAIRAGELTGDTNIKALAGFIVTALFGLSLRARAGTPREELDAQVEQLIALLPSD